MSVRVYCAGKIARWDWRQALFPALGEINRENYSRYPRGPVNGEDYRGREACRGNLVYGGPFFIDCSHGGRHDCCYAGENTHGLGNEYGGHGPRAGCGEVPHREQVVTWCKTWLKESDVVFAWMNDRTAFGTLAEIGLAHAWGIPVYWYELADHFDTGEIFEDLWFARELCVEAEVCADVQEAFQDFEARIERDLRILILKRMPHQDYLQTDHWKQKRVEALTAADYRCQLCNGVERLTVHHKTYERVGEELLTDLAILCNSCHSAFHGRLPNRGRQAYERRQQ